MLEEQQVPVLRRVPHPTQPGNWRQRWTSDRKENFLDEILSERKMHLSRNLSMLDKKKATSFVNNSLIFVLFRNKLLY